MNFIANFNEKLIKKMYFYKISSIEDFNFKGFNSKKTLVKDVFFENKFHRNTPFLKKESLKNSVILKAISNSKIKIIKPIKKANFKSTCITGVKSFLLKKESESFLIKWFFLFDCFFSENELESNTGSNSVYKTIEAFKLLRLLNSKLIGSSFFNFKISVKIVFENKNISKLFLNNYQC